MGSAPPDPAPRAQPARAAVAGRGGSIAASDTAGRAPGFSRLNSVSLTASRVTRLAAVRSTGLRSLRSLRTMHRGLMRAAAGKEIKRVRNGRILLIPGSEDTAGHGTTGQARFWKGALADLLQSAPRRMK